MVLPTSSEIYNVTSELFQQLKHEAVSHKDVGSNLDEDIFYLQAGVAYPCGVCFVIDLSRGPFFNFEVSIKFHTTSSFIAHDEVNVHCSPAKKVFFSTVANFIISPF